MPDSDASLLQSFAANRGEKAFRALSDRYLGLIYHTALRRTGNLPLSQDISQNVLCALAKKAGSLAEHPERLAAWLHRATIYESLKAMRSESAHQRRKELRHPDEIPGHSHESPWSDALPILDASLDKLSETDRTVLLLHFFENHSFPQIARTLGKSTDAVQKQSRRALEKLSRLLRGKGVALSVTCIATGLTAEFAKAAPVQMAGTLSAKAFATASPSTPSAALMIASKPKVAIPAILLICGIPLAVQQSAISSANERRAELLAITSGSGASTSPQRQRPGANRNDGISGTEFVALAERWNEIQREKGHAYNPGEESFLTDLYVGDLDRLDNETLIKWIKIGVAEPMDRFKKHAALRTLFFTLAKRDPRLALDTAVGVFPSGPGFPRAFTACGAGPILGEWAKTQPRAAFDWFAQSNLREKFGPLLSVSNARSGSLGDLTYPLLDSLLGTEPLLARELVVKIPENERIAILSSSAMSMRSKNTGIKIVAMREGGSQRPLAHSVAHLEVIKEFAPSTFENQLPSILSPLSDAEIQELVSRTHLSEQEKALVAKRVVGSAHSTVVNPDRSQTIKVDESKVRLAERISPGSYEQVRQEIRAAEEQRDDPMAQMQLQILSISPDMPEADIARILTTFRFQTRLEEALKQAERIKDPEKKSQVIEHLRKSK